MIFGGLRYGVFFDPSKPRYDHLSGMRGRLRLWSDTGDTEMLVDCANLAMCQWVEGKHGIADQVCPKLSAQSLLGLYRFHPIKAYLVGIAIDCFKNFNRYSSSTFGIIGEGNEKVPTL